MKLGILHDRERAWTLELSEESAEMLHCFIRAQSKLAIAVESLAETAIALASDSLRRAKSGGLNSMTDLEIQLQRSLAEILPLAERYAAETSDHASLMDPLQRAQSALAAFNQVEQREADLKHYSCEALARVLNRERQDKEKESEEL